jgi:membrane protease YdiL (CAAX protease family)
MSNGVTSSKKDMMRGGLTLAFGLLVVFWRVVIPTHIEITVGSVIMTAALDIVLTAAVVFLNRNELKEAFIRKFTMRSFLTILILFALSIFVEGLIPFALDRAIVLLSGLFPSMNSLVVDGVSAIYWQSPADFVAVEYHRLFPWGVFVSMAIAAPIWEEIVFRMSGRKIIKNPFLYVVITAWLFAFIHTANLFTFANITYIVGGAYFALVYLKTKDVRIVICIHFLGNFIGRILAFINQ